MTNQTLLQERIHPNLKVENMDLEIFKNIPDLMLLYNLYKPGDGTGVGYVGIKDGESKYEIGTKVFYVDLSLKELINNKHGLECGLISSNDVNTDLEKIYNKIGKSMKIPEIKLVSDYDDYNDLPKKFKAIFQAYLKIRIIECERKQNISPLEIFLLDTIEMNQRRYSNRFDLERNIKDLCKWYNFKEEKLKSGIQRRRQCRRWAKKDFEKNEGKFVSEYQYK